MCASSSSATAPATAAIGVTNTSAKGRQASTMRRATGPSTFGLSRIGVRSATSSSHSSGRIAGNRSACCRIGRAHGLGLPPRLQHHVDRPVRQVQAFARELLDDGRREHAPHPILASALQQRGRLRGIQRRQRALRHLGCHPLHGRDRGLSHRRQHQQHQPRVLDVGRLPHVAARDQPADHARDGRRVHARQAPQLVLRHRAQVVELGERRELRRRHR